MKPNRTIRALEQRQRDHRSMLYRRLRSAALGWTMAALVLLAGAGLLADRLMDPAAFPIRTVSVQGELTHVQASAVRDKVVAAIDDNFFGIDLETIETAAESVDWVRRARVRRVWPDGLRIEIDEYRLVARWGNDAWLSNEGEVVKLSAPKKTGLVRLAGPTGSAPKVLRRARQWATRLHTAGLKLEALTLNERQAWYAVAARDDGEIFSIALGRNAVAPRFARFLKGYQALADSKAARIDHIDARYPNGIAVRLKPPMTS